MASLSRRSLLGAALALAACRDDAPWHGIAVRGALPDLAFSMTRAADGAPVGQSDYRGKLVALFFGYTHCPDVCPLTLANLAAVLDRLGPQAEAARLLFVTVDPNRDSAAVLAAYAAGFGPQVAALRGSDNQLAALARRYRVSYSVQPATAERPYTVVHGPSVYVFDGRGRARLMLPKFFDASADIDGVAADFRRLIAET